MNAHDQLIWFKNIETTDTVISPTNILPTTDGGCIITGSNIISLNSSPKYLPFAMKFDSNGNVIWSKMAGDPSSSYWNQIMIRGIAPANDSGWLTSIDRKEARISARLILYLMDFVTILRSHQLLRITFLKLIHL